MKKIIPVLISLLIVGCNQKKQFDRWEIDHTIVQGIRKMFYIQNLKILEKIVFKLPYIMDFII